MLSWPIVVFRYENFWNMWNGSEGLSGHVNLPTAGHAIVAIIFTRTIIRVTTLWLCSLYCMWPTRLSPYSCLVCPRHPYDDYIVIRYAVLVQSTFIVVPHTAIIAHADLLHFRFVLWAETFWIRWKCFGLQDFTHIFLYVLEMS